MTNSKPAPRVAGTTTTARGLYDKMLEFYPDRVNPAERSGFRCAGPNGNARQRCLVPLSVADLFAQEYPPIRAASHAS
ncbi:MAG TPA: hypothetical protein VG168_06600 [Bryobacteraceae bacterium]|nr:hypothetical protein [Bryobacteraceae bacterium]